MANKVLGKLKGIIASASEKSRNNRQYTENFWDSIFNSDIFKEGLKYKMYFGELWHPDNEQEYGQIHPSDDKAAVVLTKVEKKGLDYYGEFDILPTRAGETLKNLIDIGCTFGVSSRGYSDYDTPVFDDPSTYDLITWDIVAFPGIKSARLHPIMATAESLMKCNKNKIMENLNKLAGEDKETEKYIKQVLKQKEDFDTDLQVEDLAAFNDIPDDLLDYAIVVIFNDKGIPVYNDKVHGKKRVISKIKDTPNSKYLVDDIFYDENKDAYITLGDWLKLE